MGVPAIALFLALVILGGRIALAQQAVQAAAADAARTASLARTQADARSQAHHAANRVLANQGVHCTPATITLDTPAGPVSIDVPPGTCSGRVLTVPAHGIPNPNGPSGNLHAHTHILVPTRLTPAERDLFKRLATTGLDPCWWTRGLITRRSPA